MITATVSDSTFLRAKVDEVKASLLLRAILLELENSLVGKLLREARPVSFCSGNAYPINGCIVPGHMCRLLTNWIRGNATSASRHIRSTAKCLRSALASLTCHLPHTLAFHCVSASWTQNIKHQGLNGWSLPHPTQKKNPAWWTAHKSKGCTFFFSHIQEEPALKSGGMYYFQLISQRFFVLFYWGEKSVENWPQTEDIMFDSLFIELNFKMGLSIIYEGADDHFEESTLESVFNINFHKNDISERNHILIEVTEIILLREVLHTFKVFSK